jgi:hypothetical protein
MLQHIALDDASERASDRQRALRFNPSTQEDDA